MRTELVPDALEQSLWARGKPSGLVHHPDRGSRYVFIRYSERSREVGIDASVDSVGDSYDNAMAESLIGWSLAEVIHRAGPWRGQDDVEYAALVWVQWHNDKCLHGEFGYLSPTGYGEQCMLKRNEPA